MFPASASPSLRVRDKEHTQKSKEKCSAALRRAWISLDAGAFLRIADNDNLEPRAEAS